MNSMFDCCAAVTKQIKNIQKTMLKFVVTKVTESKSQSCKVPNSYGVVTGIQTVSKGLTNCDNLSLNIIRLIQLRISLFHSVTVDEKKVLLNNCYYLLLKEYCSDFLNHLLLVLGIISLKYLGDFCSNVFLVMILNLAQNTFSLQRFFLWLP